MKTCRRELLQLCNTGSIGLMLQMPWQIVMRNAVKSRALLPYPL